MRLSQASLELSSSRGVFGSLENERKRREKREKQTLELKAAGIVLKCKSCLGLQNHGGVYKGQGGNTPKPGRLALIIQNSQGKEFRYVGRISLGSENFATLAKFR